VTACAHTAAGSSSCPAIAGVSFWVVSWGGPLRGWCAGVWWAAAAFAASPSNSKKHGTTPTRPDANGLKEIDCVRPGRPLVSASVYVSYSVFSVRKQINTPKGYRHTGIHCRFSYGALVLESNIIDMTGKCKSDPEQHAEGTLPNKLPTLSIGVIRGRFERAGENS
jgi:hypothetical protein